MAARVDDGKTLSNLIQFGRVTNQKRRVGMLLTLGANVRLEVNSIALPIENPSEKDSQLHLCMWS